MMRTFYKKVLLGTGAVLLLLVSTSLAIETPGSALNSAQAETSGGWKKSDANPVLGGKYGTCFDISVLKEGPKYRMWVSWRPQKSIAEVESADGIHWSEPPLIVLPPRKESGWEDDINRPIVIKRSDGYHMWYTGQAKGHSSIGYATSSDGKNWSRMSSAPVITTDQPWEKGAVMCPHVIWDEEQRQFRMWYSGGGQYEPEAIGYATSKDGLHWIKSEANPVFRPDKSLEWEQERVTACQVIKQDGWYLMFYIGFRDIDHAQIGVARSRDGITNWQRHPANPIVRPGFEKWDHDACYKPYAIFDGQKWLLWYNGRHGRLEQIGVVEHPGKDLGFPKLPRTRRDKRPARPVLNSNQFEHYIDAFNRDDHELYPQYISNAGSWDFLKKNIPLFDCPDKEIEEIYYFRWWTFRKHIKETPKGFIITEFLPTVPWAGKYNSICCAAGHHFHEGRWLKDPTFLDDYSLFWLGNGGNPRTYSFWIAESIWSRCEVTGDFRLAKRLLPALIKNYEEWEKDHRDPNGLFWQVDGNDGMEVSISGAMHPQAQGYRATINSYMYGDALALARIAQLAGDNVVAAKFQNKADELKRLVQEELWDNEAQFFKVLPRGENARLSNARELHGYTPWYFNLPDSDKSEAWRQLMDPAGFYAPYGPTTAEQRHPKFAISYAGHECQWNGPSWPYSTSVTLTALANFLNSREQKVITREDFFRLLKNYVKSHHLKREDGRVVPWIDENLNPINGDWIARTRLKTWKDGGWASEKGGEERGKDYNHSTFCDLIMTGLVGLRPRMDEFVEVNPLLPAGKWDYFCLDQIPYHGRSLTVIYDRTGERYGRGKGLEILADGRRIGRAKELKRITATLP